MWPLMALRVYSDPYLEWPLMEQQLTLIGAGAEWVGCERAKADIATRSHEIAFVHASQCYLPASVAGSHSAALSTTVETKLSTIAFIDAAFRS